MIFLWHATQYSYGLRRPPNRRLGPASLCIWVVPVRSSWGWTNCYAQLRAIFPTHTAFCGRWHYKLTLQFAADWHKAQKTEKKWVTATWNNGWKIGKQNQKRVTNEKKNYSRLINFLWRSISWNRCVLHDKWRTFRLVIGWRGSCKITHRSSASQQLGKFSLYYF